MILLAAFVFSALGRFSYLHTVIEVSTNQRLRGLAAEA